MSRVLQHTNKQGYGQGQGQGRFDFAEAEALPPSSAGGGQWAIDLPAACTYTAKHTEAAGWFWFIVN
jgi:hypothetical protein